MMSHSRLMIFVITATVIVAVGCGNSEIPGNKNVSYIDFSDSFRITGMITDNDRSPGELRIAVASITSPRETFRYYHDMFRHISAETGMNVTMVQRKTYSEINELAATNQIDVAFICSGGYISGIADSAFRLLVIPERNGRRTYQSFIITYQNSGIESLEDFKGRSFAFTDPLSTAGKLYPDKMLRDAGYMPDGFFNRTIYTYAHDNSIQLVSKRMIDGAAVNSLVYDYVAHTYPGRVSNIKIIYRSESFAMPPVVVSPALNDSLVMRLKSLFLEMHLDERSRHVLDMLMVDRYVAASDDDFSSVRDLLKVDRPDIK
jgi:phosphonate transport system substrate-binding protein